MHTPHTQTPPVPKARTHTLIPLHTYGACARAEAIAGRRLTSAHAPARHGAHMQTQAARRLRAETHRRQRRAHRARTRYARCTCSDGGGVGGQSATRNKFCARPLLKKTSEKALGVPPLNRFKGKVMAKVQKRFGLRRIFLDSGPPLLPRLRCSFRLNEL